MLAKGMPTPQECCVRFHRMQIRAKSNFAIVGEFVYRVEGSENHVGPPLDIGYAFLNLSTECKADSSRAAQCMSPTSS